jgi:hypothetical protein
VFAVAGVICFVEEVTTTNHTTTINYPIQMVDVEKAQGSTGNGYPGQHNNGIPHPHRVANPDALGLISFATTTFMISMYNVQARGVKVPNVIAGTGIFCGGLAQLLAGMWAFCQMNTFAATAFTSYGAFWMSYASIFIPGSGILAAYADGPADEFSNALGIVLITWFLVTFLFFIVALRKSVAFIFLFGFVSTTFALLATAELSGKEHFTKVGGGVGIVTAMIAYYMGLAELLASEELAIVKLPLGAFKRD